MIDKNILLGNNASMTVRQQIAALVRNSDNPSAIAAATKVDKATLSRIASGERQPSGEVIDRLAAYYGVELRKIRSKAQ